MSQHPYHRPASPAIVASSTRLSERSARRRNHREISCAECRRLRIKCDKRVPCGMCIRRGCQDLCPHGVKITTDGTRTVLAATEGLQGTISDLRERIRILETALNDIHIDRTGHTHSLLVTSQDSDDENDRLQEQADSNIKADAGNDTALILGQDGVQRIAGAYNHDRFWLAHSGEQARSLAFPTDEEPFATVARAIRHYPFAPSPPFSTDVLPLLRGSIPTEQVCRALLEVFQNSIGSSLLPAFTVEYVHSTLIPNALHSDGVLGLAALSTLYAVLGIGALFAVEGPGEAPEVARFAWLSSSAFCPIGILTLPSLELIEAIYTRGMLELLRQGPKEEVARFSLAMAGQMCLALGLHRDGELIGLSPEVSERRRVVFWMVYKTDAWESLSIGRPANIAIDRKYIDTRLPSLGSLASPDLARALANAMIVVADIARATLSLKPPSYAKILELDERARKVATPAVKAITPAHMPPSTFIMMYLHRAFFARAVLKHPDDPSKSEYAYSFQAVLRSARDTIAWLEAIVRQAPAMCARIHYVWSISASAAMVYKLLLDRSPASDHAREARAGLDLAMGLFGHGAKHGSGRAKRALTMFTSRGEKVPSPQSSPPTDEMHSPEVKHSTAKVKNELPTSPPTPVAWDPKIPTGYAFPLIDPDESIQSPDPTQSSQPDSRSGAASRSKRGGLKAKAETKSFRSEGGSRLKPASRSSSAPYPPHFSRQLRPIPSDSPGSSRDLMYGTRRGSIVDTDVQRISLARGHTQPFPVVDHHALAQDSSSRAPPELQIDTSMDMPFYTQPTSDAYLSARWEEPGWTLVEQGHVPPSSTAPQPAVDDITPQWLDTFGPVDPSAASSLNGEWTTSWMAGATNPNSYA